MTKMTIVCKDNFRCVATNEQGLTFSTDAPKEMGGTGNAFSPTDILAVSVCTCMMTMMVFAAKRSGIILKGTKADVVKEMTGGPKNRLKRISVTFYMLTGIPPERRKILENAAHTCPVYNSLHPDIKHEISFQYGD